MTAVTTTAATIRLSPAQTRVLRLLRKYRGGLSDEDIAASYVAHVRRDGWPMQSAASLRTRRAELVAAGLVVAAGKRTGSAGRSVTVWKPVPVEEITATGDAS